jgi:hypothetical protein
MNSTPFGPDVEIDWEAVREQQELHSVEVPYDAERDKPPPQPEEERAELGRRLIQVFFPVGYSDADDTRPFGEVFKNAERVWKARASGTLFVPLAWEHRQATRKRSNVRGRVRAPRRARRHAARVAARSGPPKGGDPPEPPSSALRSRRAA